MIIIIRTGATEEELQAIVARAVALGLPHHLSRGAERSVLIVNGDAAALGQEFEPLAGVESVLPFNRPYRLSSREVHPRDTAVSVGGLLIGAAAPVLIAGVAAAVPGPAGIRLASSLRDAGADAVRIGVYRPLTGLFSTPQLDPEALQQLDGVRRETGMPVATDVFAAEDVPAIARHADMLIVGGEQMHSRPLLQACGWSNRAVIVQRSESARVEEWLQAADQLLAAGNHQVLLCERGIRTYETATRRTLDLSAVPYIRRVSHLPVLVDPAQATEHADLIEPLALAAVAAGAQGLLLAVHESGMAPPEGETTIDLAALRSLTTRLKRLIAAMQ